MPEEMSPLPDDLREVEQFLATVIPAPATVSRDTLLYEAGRAAGKRAGHLRLWQGTCGVCAALALAASLLSRTHPRDPLTAHDPLAKVIPANEPSPAPVALSALAKSTPSPQEVIPDDLNSLAMRRLVLNNDAGALRWSSAAIRAGGPSMDAPALTPEDGLNALPAWQRRLAGGSQGERL